MKSRERVKRAFHFDKPDRVPKTCFSLSTDFFAFPCLDSKHFQPTNYPPHTSGGPHGQKSLFNRLFITHYKWKKKKRQKLGLPKDWWYVDDNVQLLTIDEWGIIWSSGGIDRDFTMGHPYIGPFQESWDDFENYQFPDPLDESRYRFWNPLMKLIGKDKYLIGHLGLSFLHNLPSWLRGFTNIMVDFIKNPNKVHELIKVVTDYFYMLILTLKETCPTLDCIMTCDDLGTQKSPFLSPVMFKKFFYQPYKKLIDLIHDLNMDFILHSCGQLKELLPTFYDLGIDVLEFDSPNMTGVENFKEYAEQQKMAFWLSPNIQSTFFQGTPEELEEEIKYYVKEVGNNYGGLAFYEYLDHRVLNVPKENVKALHRATKKWGKYNKDGIIDWLA